MDIALAFNKSLFEGDISLANGDLASDNDLYTAIYISLFTDRRASNDDPIVQGESLRGWWADTYSEVSGDKIGSKLWLLRREKQLSTVLQRAKNYALEATQWLIEDRVAQSVQVEAEVFGEKQNGILALSVTVKKPEGAQTFRYSYAWDQI